MWQKVISHVHVALSKRQIFPRHQLESNQGGKITLQPKETIKEEELLQVTAF